MKSSKVSRSGSVAPITKSSDVASVDRSFWLRLLTTTFLGAFLLFQVQPLIGKAVLPWYGGTPAVWTTALLFFQLMLVAGYALAHLSVRCLSPAARSYVFIGIALVAVALLPIHPGETWKPQPDDEPIRHMLALLLVCVGGPYFVLASTAPTAQQWYIRSGTTRSPYRLYALSNLGSLLGLLTYPFVVERFFDAQTQSLLWSIGFGLYAISAASCAWSVRRRADPMPSADAGTRDDERISFGRWGTWIGLSAAGTVLLMSCTYHLCQDIASVPFLWVAPLVTYLLTFIICFDHARWYCRTWYSAAAAILIPLACLQGATFASLETSKVWLARYLMPLRDVSFGTQAVIVLGMLFATCMLCHGELAARKPSPSRLTLYFLLVSLGGALGGLFTAVVAPTIFDRNWEWMLATLGAFALAFAGIMRTLGDSGAAQNRTYRTGLLTVGFAGVILIGWLHALSFKDDELVSARNFYGVVSVDVGRARDTGEPIYMSMRSGTTFHGLQLVGEEFRRRPTAYYGPTSGVGLALLEERKCDKPLRVAVIGLGVGTLAAYARPGDVYDFFEINPVVERLADEHFSFLRDARDSGAQCRVVLGDARLSLEAALPRDGSRPDEAVLYDIVVLDAFSGDSIPTHLLTVEALATYLRALADDGLIAVHTSNRHLDLVPVVAAAAKQHELSGITGVNRPDPANYLQSARWVLLTRNPNTESWRKLRGLGFADLTQARPIRVWTDAYSNLFEILK
jgi:hypothetical protein